MEGIALSEHGFFHPLRGYWQTVSDVPQHILDSYPEGTIEVPLRPSPDYDWLDGSWVYAPLPIPSPTLEEQQMNRQSAFQREADPLFFKWQAGEATEQEWLDARNAVRERYPYPE